MLKDTAPEVYAQHMRKYQGREELTQRVVPHLNCLWNDVLFFCAVHPQKLRDACISAVHPWKPQQWYEIDPQISSFTSQNTVIYYSVLKASKGDFSFQPEQFVTFDADLLIENEVPAETLQYYREAKETGERLFLWRGIPHILHHGTVLLEKVNEIEV